MFAYRERLSTATVMVIIGSIFATKEIPRWEACLSLILRYNKESFKKREFVYGSEEQKTFSQAHQKSSSRHTGLCKYLTLDINDINMAFNYRLRRRLALLGKNSH